ncbi:MAG TPA: CheR family methyltransferase [Gemmatimonadaceae bacterium]|nr:CheR family methyltransferase [Gemmatimonadaceae bacterium]
MSSRPSVGLATLIEYLRRGRGFDFTGYKPASLERRVLKRIQSLGLVDYGDYLDYLEVHPEEYEILFNTILINVTAFFRDAGTWEFLEKEVVPPLLDRRSDGGPIRVWSAGCASGEEAYSLAMLFAEALGPAAYRERVKIYATDIDEEALARARQAIYDAKDVEGVPPALLTKYLEESGGNFVFRQEFRRNVIFGRHNLMQDAPISRVDLLSCRNTLMYFNAETQARILTRFHFALNDGGILLLGRAETLLNQASAFEPIDLRRRISAKLPRASLNLRDRLLLLTQPDSSDENAVDTESRVRLRELAFDAVPTAQIVVDLEGMLVLANERARALVPLMPADIGRPIQDLKISYRPVEIRSCIDQARAERIPILLRDIEWLSASGETRWLDIQIVPLIDPGNILIGVAITFVDVTVSKRLQRELEHANQELETAYEELQSTNEELETTNEELQSTVEELETTNEELQSTNEELETMNEELQSTNEELQTTNIESRRHSDELNDVNAFLESILTGLRGGVAVVDADFKVLVWNRQAEDLWGLRADEAVGRQLLSLDIGIPLERLTQPMRECLSGARTYVELELECTNRRGRAIRCRVTCSPLFSAQRAIRGVIVMMEDLETGAPLSSPRASRPRQAAESSR